ncbi:CsiV family protein [Gallaecimonas kandeliae]|uniref:CsiV family protein n=1 Tax=Gallaecimonas kandeliae TaxID=3029055 RepID=UPI0026499809|nr:CsiV family protein [Gallaecimonas kandeliae]WKE67038.1 CsiV family protein [Gallaecimonas kandeliae]
MQKLLKGSALALLVLASAQALATATVFDVELIVVARQDNSDETWPPKALPGGNLNALLTDREAALCIAPCTDLPVDVTAPPPAPGQDDTKAATGTEAAPGDQASPDEANEPLPRLLRADELQLNEAAAKLARLPGGRVLLHTGWRLAPKQPRYATPMAVEAGRDMTPYQLSAPVAEGTLTEGSDNPGAAQATTEGQGQTGAQPQDAQPPVAAAEATGSAPSQTGETQTTAAAQGTGLGEGTGENPGDAGVAQTHGLPALPELSGQIQVALDHYLLVDMALDLRTIQGEGQPLLIKTLRQKRRLKSGEWHYFDHPALGVLMQIRPVL